MYLERLSSKPVSEVKTRIRKEGKSIRNQTIWASRNL